MTCGTTYRMVIWCQIILYSMVVGAFCATTMLNSFNSGELSPLLEGRCDVKRYYSGCKTVENFVVMPQGGVTKRPGTRYVATIADSDDNCRLMPFEYSTEQAYIVELGDHYARFYMNGAPVMPGAIYQISTPYAEADLDTIQHVQSANIMYLVDSNYPVHVLTRTSHTSWTLTQVDFRRGPFKTPNITATMVTPSATTGTITLTASADLFNANHIGALWQLTHTVSAAEIAGSFASNGDSASVAIQQGRDFDFTTHGAWAGTIYLQRSYDGGTTWKDVQPFSNDKDDNISYAETETVDDAVYRVHMTNYSSGLCNYSLVARSFDVDGVVRVAGYTDARTVSANVLYTLGGTTATTNWAEGAFSQDEGYPGAITFHNGRLVLGGTRVQPDTLWFSAVDGWDNFRAGTDSSDSFTCTLVSNSVDAICWLVSQSKLLVGTAGSEWTISSSASDEPLTATNITARRQSSYGSAPVQAVAMNNVVVFVQRQGRKIRKLIYSFELDNWIAPDETAISEHITSSGLAHIALQKNPYDILWCVRNDGELAGMTLEESQEVLGWHRQLFDGDVLDCAVISGDGEDEVWFVMAHNVQGSTVKYIEQLQPYSYDNNDDMYFVDCGLTWDGGSPVAVANISLANPCIADVPGHTFSSGDIIRFSSMGRMQLNNKVYTVSTVSGNEFELRDKTDTTDIDATSFAPYAGGGSVTREAKTFSGLDHLEGRSVVILADGSYAGIRTVSGAVVTLPDYYNTVHIGLPYTSKLATMPLELASAPGILFAANQRVTDVTIRFYESLACDVGTSWTDYTSYTFKSSTDTTEVATPLFSGIKTIEFPGDYEDAISLYIQSRLPLPLTVLSLKAKFEAYE